MDRLLHHSALAVNPRMSGHLMGCVRSMYSRGVTIVARSLQVFVAILLAVWRLLLPETDG